MMFSNSPIYSVRDIANIISIAPNNVRKTLRIKQISVHDTVKKGSNDISLYLFSDLPEHWQTAINMHKFKLAKEEERRRNAEAEEDRKKEEALCGSCFRGM